MVTVGFFGRVLSIAASGDCVPRLHARRPPPTRGSECQLRRRNATKGRYHSPVVPPLRHSAVRTSAQVRPRGQLWFIRRRVTRTAAAPTASSAPPTASPPNSPPVRGRSPPLSRSALSSESAPESESFPESSP